MNPKYRSRSEELRKTLYKFWIEREQGNYPDFDMFYDDMLQHIIWMFQLILDEDKTQD